ncbi:MAG: phosphotransferase family protein [Solirubrobacteraceae bacterium]
MRWTQGLLVPERLRLRATAGQAGAEAARLLYQQRRHPTLAPAARGARSLALARGWGRHCAPPVDAFDELCERLGVAPVGAAAIQSWLADRLVVCIVGLRTSVVVKLGTAEDSGIATEAMLLGELEGTAGPASVPRLRWHGVWRDHLVLATEVIQLAERQREVTLDEAAEIATALTLGSTAATPLVHGDFSPSNLLRTPDGLALVDWERGRLAREPLFDLAHFVVTRGSLLRREPADRAVAQLTAPGSPGWRHLAAVGVDPYSAPALLQDYVERTWDHNEVTWPYRRALLHILEAVPGTHSEPAGATPR